MGDQLPVAASRADSDSKSTHDSSLISYIMGVAVVKNDTLNNNAVMSSRPNGEKRDARRAGRALAGLLDSSGVVSEREGVGDIL